LKIRQHLARFKELITEDNIVLNENSLSNKGKKEANSEGIFSIIAEGFEESKERADFGLSDKFSSPFHSVDNSLLLLNDDLMFLRFLWGN
jgi:hypothetical protein